jgi:ankyrin repeat protein
MFSMPTFRKYAQDGDQYAQDGETALHVAVIQGHVEAVEYLCEAGGTELIFARVA